MSSPDISVTYSIGELVAATGASHRSLRYYEQQGLLSAQRTTAGHRRFGPDAVDRVLLVQRLFAGGLTSAEIRPALSSLLGDEPPAQDLTAELRRHRLRLQQEVARHLDAIDILEEVIDEFEGPDQA